MYSKIILGLFAILYLGLGIWCAILPETTAKAVGFTLNGSSGFSEYLTVYGGLEVSMGLFFLLCFIKKDLFLAGLYFAFLSSFCLFSFRTTGFFLKDNFEVITIITYCVEITLTVISALALRFTK